MKQPETIVVSREMAEKLKKAGWDKETVFNWYTWPNGVSKLATRSQAEEYFSNRAKEIPAPTFQEIWEEVPHQIDFPWATVQSSRIALEHTAITMQPMNPILVAQFVPKLKEGMSFVDYIATLWIVCKENNYI